MITGTVSADREAVIRVKIIGQLGQELEIDAIIDTGFTGYITLPNSIINTLSLPFHSRQQVVLGDGNVHTVNVHTGIVNWEGQNHRIEIDAADTTPLLGMAMMYGYKLTIEDIDGGAVCIELI